MVRLVDRDLAHSLGLYLPMMFKIHRPEILPLQRMVMHAVNPLIKKFAEIAFDAVDIPLAFERATVEVADQVGPHLWPAKSVNRSAWLADARSDDLNGLYPKDLFYEIDRDRYDSPIQSQHPQA